MSGKSCVPFFPLLDYACDPAMLFVVPARVSSPLDEEDDHVRQRWRWQCGQGSRRREFIVIKQ